jgi:uncharacterized protein
MPKVNQTQIKERVEFLVKEAEEGDTDSMRLLADIYCGGEYLSKDDFAAEAWLRKAAELGDDKAKFQLAELLREGNGLAKNLEESFDIFHELSFDGYADAMVEIGKAMIEGIGTPRNVEMGNRYLRYGKCIGEGLEEDEKKVEIMYEDLKKNKKK